MGNLGWPEILIILGIALIIFGPRKLPELGKSLGQSLAQFRRASEDFKRTWEQEVEMEKYKLNAALDEAQYTAKEEDTYEPKQEAEGAPVEQTEPPVGMGEPPVEQPAIEQGAVEQTAAAAEQGEAVAQESGRDWV
jgi:TatA/E family protein of Tat protein translocase